MTSAAITSPTVASGDVSTEFFLAARAAGSIAWDIETSGLDWNTDLIGTVQLALPDGTSTLVQISPDIIPPNLSTLLEFPGIVKIFHHAPFDLRFMANAWRVKPANVVCTKVLSRILFPARKKEEHSLKPLLEDVIGVHITKSSVRTSDWTVSELSAEQINYAVGDVLHLHRLFDALMEKAVSAGVAGLAEASFGYIPVRVLTDLRQCGDVFAY